MSSKADFLSNMPLGIDLMDGHSQNIVAEAIKRHMMEADAENNDKNTLPRIIGVEGAWGSGKSNMLIQLQEKLKSYYFFTYDAWGNQEDLQRRSILEQLTDELIQKKLLVKDTEITVLNTNLDEEPTPIRCSWKRRLFSLVSRKSATHNVTIPRIEDSVKWFALSLVSVGIMAAIASATDFVDCSIVNFLIVFFLSILPFVGFCILRKCKYMQQLKGNKNVRGWAWKEMWLMYQTEGTQDTTTYTISELEPSVSEFRKWMNDLADSLKDNQRLVIVFDNMDRLPREKVRQLWSSIQTFFAGNEYNKVWCIIPFDKDHLANAFAEESSEKEEKKKLANYFIEKTFPVVYRIPEPIITDYKGVFKELFKKSFGDREEQDLINRCYRLKYSKPNMREIVSYINKCVSLCHTWGDEIRLMSIALFELNNDIILGQNDPDNVIVNGKYMGMFGNLIEDDDFLPIEMSSLVYGVSKKKSAQLPLKNITSQALRNKNVTDFDKYAKEQPDFFEVLDEVTSEMDTIYLNNAINNVSAIHRSDVNEENQNMLNKIWIRLANVYIKEKQNESSFRNEVRVLMDNCPKKELKEKIAKKFIESFTNEEKNNHKGSDWYIVYKEFEEYTKNNGLSIVLPEKVLPADVFFDYVTAAQEEYDLFPVYCGNDDINAATLTWMNVGRDISKALGLLINNEKYDFSSLLDKARKMIEEESATNDNIEAVLKTCKILSNQPLKLKVNLNYINQLSNNGDALYDLQLLRVLSGQEINEVNDDYFSQMAEIAYHYSDTYDVWEKTRSYSTRAIAKVMSCLINNNKHEGQPLAIKDMLTEMADIERRTSVPLHALITFVNGWGKETLNNDEKKVSLPSVFSDNIWISAFLEENTPLSQAILDKYYEDINDQPITSFLNPNNSWTGPNYWLNAIKIFVDNKVFMKKCFGKMKEITNHLIEGICTGQIVEGNPNMELQQKLLSKIIFPEVSTKVNEMMGKFGNNQLKINKYIFISLHDYFEQTKGYETQFLNNILKPIINDADVQNIIIDNISFYEPLLKNNIVQASDLRAEMIELFNSTSNESLKNMIGHLNIIDNYNPNTLLDKE